MYNMCDRCLSKPAQLCLECAEKISHTKRQTESAALSDIVMKELSFLGIVVPDGFKQHIEAGFVRQHSIDNTPCYGCGSQTENKISLCSTCKKDIWPE